MPPSDLRRKILGRRSVRARIGLACAGLFLVTGGAFVAATYTLVDHSLPSALQLSATNPNKVNKQLLGSLQAWEGRTARSLDAQLAHCNKLFAERNPRYQRVFYLA